jgi:AraC-like DNA-binding protein
MKHIKTLSEFHAFRNLPAPLHPLISVIDVSTVPHWQGEEPQSIALDFFCISVKRMGNVKIKYGQQPFDFNEGIMSFMAPKQVFGMMIDDPAKEVIKSGWVIYIHPDFIWNTSLAAGIKGHEFWDYSFNEALFLSAKEEGLILNIVQNIKQEYQSNIDRFSKQIIISQLESLLNYADRFYNRQFITREKANHEVLQKLERLLADYFNSDLVSRLGLPTVKYVAEQLHLSPKYLSSLLRIHTGQNTQQHIHDTLIEKAKEKLTTTTLSVSEIAYELGFEHLQSFSKLFKTKTKLSPLEFRASFN